ncbi:MAG: YARHG domain-containing protein [Methylovirgula sp.]
MPLHKLALRLFLGTATVSALLASGFGEAARAQDAASMSCGELWHARNAIYARNGYCFKTARGRAVFGPGCFPPYGALSGSERARVNDLQYWERQKGC